MTNGKTEAALKKYAIGNQFTEWTIVDHCYAIDDHRLYCVCRCSCDPNTVYLVRATVMGQGQSKGCRKCQSKRRLQTMKNMQTEIYLRALPKRDYVDKCDAKGRAYVGKHSQQERFDRLWNLMLAQPYGSELGAKLRAKLMTMKSC